MVAKGVMILLGIIVGVVAVTAMALMFGPISLSPLKPTVEGVLNRNFGDTTIQFEDLVLNWDSWDDGIDIRALGVAVQNPNGEQIAYLSQIAIGFETSAVVDGRLAPESLTIINPDLRLLRREDGSMGFAPVATGGANYEAVLAQIVQLLVDKPAGGGLDRLREVRVVDATLTIDDLAYASDWTIEDVHLVFAKAEAGLSVQLRGAFTAESRTSHIDLALLYDKESGRSAVDVDIQDLTPSDLHRDFGFWQQLHGLELPVSLSASLQTTPSFDVEDVSFEIKVGDGTILRPKVFADRLRVVRGHIMGNLDRSEGKLTLSRINLLANGASFDISGHIMLEGEGVAYDADIVIQNLTFPNLARVWPVSFKPFSRGWIERNITGGTINRLEGQFGLGADYETGPLPDGTFTAAFDFEGMEAHYLRPMPPVIDGTGQGTFTEKTLDVLVKTARIADAETGMNIDLTNSHVLLDNLNVERVHDAVISTDIAGQISDLVYITTFEPLKFVKEYSIDPAELGGAGEAHLEVRFPLLQKLLFRDVDMEINGKITDFYAAILEGRTEISEGDLDLFINSHHLETAGSVKVGGLAFQATWSEKFVRGDSFGSIVTLNGPSTVPALEEAMGFDIPFTGSVDISLNLRGNGLNIVEGDGKLGFAQSDIHIPLLTWEKPLGQSTNLTFNLVVEEGHIAIPDFDLLGEALTAKGQAIFGFDLIPQQIEVHELLVNANNLTTDLDFSDGGSSISGRIGGASMDVRPVIDTLFDEGEAGEGFDIEVDVSFNEVLAHEGTRLQDFVGLLRLENSALRDIHMSGLIGSKHSFFVSSIPYPEETEVELLSDNAGYVVRALGVFDGAEGGDVRLNARTRVAVEKDITTGRVRIRDFTVGNAPGLAQVLNVASITGLRDIMSGGGISFDTFELGFRLESGLLTFNDAVALGPSIGLRMDGELRNNFEQIDVSGTIIPAYTINTIIRSVPIVGDIITGGAQDGFLGIDFTMTGSTDNPEVDVDTASILTPGFIKGIFGGGRN